ncbi:Uridylate kinase [Chlamydiales bacterium SCGC AG-110-M15]|nr:Uridylate kinase [Chlamydiales bacterium SCGC AG-110-M15]
MPRFFFGRSIFMTIKKPLYKSILLKLSGESLMGDQGFGIHAETCLKVAKDIKFICDAGVRVSIVLGAGNIFRGVNGGAFAMKRVVADQVGMFSTIINGTVMQQCLESLGCTAHVMSGFAHGGIVERYDWRAASEALDRGEIVIFVGGTGNPFFTTDTAAALRASEFKADLLLKATKVDGIYDQDPVKFPQASKYDKISYTQAIQDQLRVMDITAMTLCMENHVPIRVVQTSSIARAIYEADLGTIVEGESQV